jgi:electron transfer flavoprotein alpha subunit
VSARVASGVLVLAETRSGALRPVSLELIGAARALSAQGAGPVAVALIGSDAEALAKAVDVSGVGVGVGGGGVVGEVLAVPTPQTHFEAHVTQTAVEQLIARRRPSLVLAGHTIDSLGFAPAVAARGAHGFASDVTAVSWGEHGALARRPAYGEELIAELDFPGKETVVLLLRPGAFPAAGDGRGRTSEDDERAVVGAEAAMGEDSGAGESEDSAGAATIERVELDLAAAARSEHVELREAPSGDSDIAKAGFLLAIGRGVASAEQVSKLEALAARIGAALAVSGPLVEAGWASRARKVGQSGKTVAPRVYLALGISGAAQHLAGMSRSRTIVAVNTDPGARIFDVADYGAVADLFEVAAELERQLG